MQLPGVLILSQHLEMPIFWGQASSISKASKAGLALFMLCYSTLLLLSPGLSYVLSITFRGFMVSHDSLCLFLVYSGLMGTDKSPLSLYGSYISPLESLLVWWPILCPIRITALDFTQQWHVPVICCGDTCYLQLVPQTETGSLF
jgi:hypothetical protein